MNVVIYAPSDDPATIRARWFAERVEERLKAENVPTMRVPGPDRKQLESHLGNNLGLAAFCHGSLDGLHNGNGERVVDAQNLSLLEGAWLYACACESGKRLIYMAVNNGARIAAGYQNRIDTAGIPNAIPTPIKPLFHQLISETVMMLHNGITEPKEYRRRLREIERQILSWIVEHPDENVNTITISQFVYRLEIYSR